jgi:acyl transferase domain-containing protein
MSQMIPTQVAEHSTTEQLLLALRQARKKLEALDRQQAEPIAVVGIGCRLPGGVNHPLRFWSLLRDGIDAISVTPQTRWNIDAFYDPNPDASGKMYTRQGGFLDDVDQFDPQFFGISPREAESMDPQQRLLLEVCWEALENAGLAADQLRGSQSGVFLGICFDDYAQLVRHAGDLSRIDGYSGLGNARSIAAGRIAYVLGWQGPVLQLDTSCSSSLLSVHLACQSLRHQECHLAIAGGVNLILSPENTIEFCKLKALSADGRCKTFDCSADGYGRGEGCGIVLLKRLSDALSNGDRILGLIRGSAVNHDGQSNGLTAPNGAAQEQLIRQALVNARVNPEHIQYVETHGTGTVLGDPIEVMALAKVLGEGRSADSPLLIGSVKTNVGHLESAAGITSLIKVILSLQHQEIPPHLHFQTPNPYIPWSQLPIAVPQVLTPWRSEARPRLAGVSSFGMSGTNVHVVIEEAPSPSEIKMEGPVNRMGVAHSEHDHLSNSLRSERSLHLLTLSAKCQPALKDLAQRYQRYLSRNLNVDLGDVCFTANTGRSHFDHRLAILARSPEHLQEQLASVIAGRELPGVYQGLVLPSSGNQQVCSSPDLGGAGMAADLQNNGHRDSVLQQFAESYVKGVAIDWLQLDQGYRRQRLELPTYPFQRSRYWIATDDSASESQAPLLLPFAFRPPSLRPQLQQTPIRDRLDLLITHIQSAIARVLKLSPQAIPSPRQGFVEMGLDSLMAVELQRLLESSLELSLSPTLAFNYPTIERLAPYLLQQIQNGLDQDLQPEVPMATVEFEAMAAQLQTLSEVEMEALLVRKLNSLSLTH